ncbi:hypothetical protein NQ314_017266 [Rhamnusium bicolor]|uniref:malate dehydrogenase n=1 Tax=Rhamnusium bicolor TaxID=1586634 RepID=A0AAV8WV81_9CUCU|nr:hypothetical protein NQ314_017266 [Rhamnusium bicolor]
MNLQNFIHRKSVLKTHQIVKLLDFIISEAFQSYSKRKISSSTEFQKSIQVCVLGAHTSLGRATSFLLKQNPLISVLKVQGEPSVKNLAIDLNQIDTKCHVQGFDGIINVSKALRKLKEETSVVDRVMAEGKRVYDLAKECTIYAPRSIIIVSAPPVSVLTPLVEGVFKGTNWYHPGRIIGSAAIAQIKANTLMGRDQDLDPKICNVPIIGGPDIDLAVPLFSRASPIDIIDRSARRLLARFRGVKEINFPEIISRPNYVENYDMSEAFALNNMITTIGLGICGDEKAYYCAYVRANLVNACRHLVTTVQFSRGGIVHNFGLPQLTKLELKMFEKATLDIGKREQMAQEFLEIAESGKPTVPPFKLKDLEIKKMLQQKVVRA